MFTQWAYGLQWPKLFGTGRTILNSKFFFHQIHILKKIYKATRIGNNPP